MSYHRMMQREKELEREIERLLAEADEADALEDALYGKGKKGDEIPEELAFRETRLKKIKEAKAALEKRVRKEKGKDPDPKDQINFTDPESRIMKDSATKEFVQGYNAQCAADAESQVVIAADVTGQTNDRKQIEPMTGLMQHNLGRLPKRLSADAGYFSEDNISFLQRHNIEALIPPDRVRHTEKPPAAPRGRIPDTLSVKDRMRRLLTTKKGKKLYAKRKETVEPVFGQIKEERGFRRFLLRGLEKVKAEWQLICASHNLLKLYRWKTAHTAT